MYNISDSNTKKLVYSALSSPTREFRNRISFGEGIGARFTKHFDVAKGIKTLNISQEGNSDGDGLVFGSCCVSSAVAEFYNPDKTYNYANKTMFVECGIKLSDDSFFYIPCGYFKIDKPETEDEWATVRLTSYDDVDRMTKKWNTNLSMPSNAYLLFKEIADKYNLELDIDTSLANEMKARVITEAEAVTLTSYTEREVCGFLAGLFAGNARINTVGKLAVKRYSYAPKDGFEVSLAVQWQNGFRKKSEQEFEINSITSGIGDNVFTAGTGKGVSFVNPIITEKEIEEIYETYYGFTFQPSDCEWRGNPCYECHDTVYVYDKSDNSCIVYVARQDIDLTGGLSMITHCPGGDADISFDTVNEQIRAALNRQYTQLQQAIIDATNRINGAQGGYYEVLDNDKDGNPDGWLIKQYMDGSGGLIRANYEGIGLSKDGGKTYSTAIDYNGVHGESIVAGSITVDKLAAGTITADKISLANLNNLSVINPDNEYYPFMTEDSTVSYGTKDGVNYFAFGKLDKAGYYNIILNKIAGNAVFNKNDTFILRCTMSASTTTKVNFLFKAYYKEGGSSNLAAVAIKDSANNNISTTDVNYTIPFTMGTTPTKSVDYYMLMLETDNSAGQVYVRDISVYQSTNGVLLADGAVSADKIAANSITADKIDAKSIQTRHLDTDNLVIGTGNVEGLADELSDIVDTANTASANASTASQNASATALKLGAVTAEKNGVVYVQGSTILAGSIGVNQLAAGSVTADKLSIGSSLRENLFFNHNFSVEDNDAKISFGWASKNGTINLQSGDWITFTPSTIYSPSSIYQKVWLKPGKYSIVARINPYNITNYTSDAYIGYQHGETSTADTTALLVDSDTIQYGTNADMIVKYLFEYNESEGYVDVGITFKGLQAQYFAVVWMGLFEADEELTNAEFFCSNSYWLKDGYKTSNKLNYSSYISAFQNYVTPFWVDESGTLDVISGRLGCTDFSRNQLEIMSHVTEANLNVTFDGSLVIKRPLTGLNPNISTDVWGGFAEATAPSITTSVGSNKSVLTAYHFACKDSSDQAYMRPGRIQTTGTLKCSNCDCTSREKYKNNISEKTSVLDKIKNSKIYEYKLNNEDDKHKRKTGFIVERETPEEIISDDGDGINLYSMASMNWKATQEILARLEALEEKAVKH